MATASDKPICCFCHLPRADRECPLCTEPVCRGCSENVGDDAFAYMATIPTELQHHSYCPACFDATIAPQRDEYEAKVEKAKNVGYWARAYKGHVPVIKKALKRVNVEGARDRGDALMRLAYQAVEQGYNGLVQGEVVARKERDHGYQKMLWSGHAVPALIDEEKLERHEYNEATWRVIAHR